MHSRVSIPGSQVAGSLQGALEGAHRNACSYCDAWHETVTYLEELDAAAGPRPETPSSRSSSVSRRCFCVLCSFFKCGIHQKKVGKTIINHPFGNGVHHLFMILGRIYCCFTHIIGYWLLAIGICSALSFFHFLGHVNPSLSRFLMTWIGQSGVRFFVFWGAILSKSKVLDFAPSDVDSEDPSDMEDPSAEGILESVDAGEVWWGPSWSSWRLIRGDYTHISYN